MPRWSRAVREMGHGQWHESSGWGMREDTAVLFVEIETEDRVNPKISVEEFARYKDSKGTLLFCGDGKTAGIFRFTIASVGRDGTMQDVGLPLKIAFLHRDSKLEAELHKQHQACGDGSKMPLEYERLAPVSHRRYRYCLENPRLGLASCCWTRPVTPATWPQAWEAAEGPTGSAELHIALWSGTCDQGSKIVAGLGNDLLQLAEALVEAEEDMSVATVRFDLADAKRERLSRRVQAQFPTLEQPKENETLSESLSAARGLENATIEVRHRSPSGIISSRPALPWGSMHRGRKAGGYQHREHRDPHELEFFDDFPTRLTRGDLGLISRRLLAREHGDKFEGLHAQRGSHEPSDKALLQRFGDNDWIQGTMPIFSIRRALGLYLKPRLGFLQSMHNSECDDTLVIHLRSGDVHFKDYNPWREKLIAVETAEFFREAWRRSGLRSMHINVTSSPRLGIHTLQ